MKRPEMEEFLYHFYVTKDYFECHEIGEELWKEVAPREKSHFLVGFVLLATGLYHWRRANFDGALRSLEKSLKLLLANRILLEDYLDFEKLDTLFLELIREVANHSPYESIQLPIRDMELKAKIASFPPALHVGDEIIHRHSTRDRSDVILARQQALLKRRK